MPKFKMEAKCDLESTLEVLGSRDVFIAGKADLSGISNNKLVVSKFVHQAYVEVNEEGTEAAAATEIVVVPGSANILPEFTANLHKTQ